MGNFVRVAGVQEIPTGKGKQVEVGAVRIALFNVEGSFYAIEAFCAHMGEPLANGELRGTMVICPWHGWGFDVTDGCFIRQPRTCLDTFAVRVEGQDILVEIP